MLRFPTLLLALLAVLAAAAPALAAPLTLERVVLIQRHGVRPPTSSNADLAKYAAQPWPDWPVAPGELTPHGALTVTLMGGTLREAYRAKGLLPARGCPTDGQVSVWADGADQRTRRTGELTAEALAPGCGIKAGWAPPLPRDPVFSGSPTDAACKVDPAEGAAAMLAAAGPDGLDTPPAREAMTRLQAIVAPDGCKGGPGACFTGDDSIGQTPLGPRLQGPMSISASLAEDLLLEYADDKPLPEVGWGKVRSARDIAAMMPAHEQMFSTIRHNPYLAARQGGLMARMVLGALNGDPSGTVPGPTYGPASKVVVFAGHDTNIALMGALFGLDWTLPGEPDITSPAQVLALEVLADPATGKRYLRPVMYYETLDQLRFLTPARAQEAPVRFEVCADVRDGACSLAEVTRRVASLIPAGCGEIDAAAETKRQ